MVYFTEREQRNEQRAPHTFNAMTGTPEEPEACTDARHVSGESPIDIGLKLAAFPSDLLLQLAEMLGNPLALLVSKAHLSKALVAYTGFVKT